MAKPPKALSLVLTLLCISQTSRARWISPFSHQGGERQEAFVKVDESTVESDAKLGHRSTSSSNEDRTTNKRPSARSSLYREHIQRMVPHDSFTNNIDETLVSAGHFHTCGIERRPGLSYGGPVRCWGRNDHGQTKATPGFYKQVSSGHHHSCAIGTDSAIQCWGSISSPFANGPYKQVSSGGNHVCAVHQDGSLECFGSNHHGESDPPAEGRYAQVSSGEGYSCGLRRDGTVQCWGKDHEGQSQPSSEKFKQISAGLDHHVCGITLNGAIRCWGMNSRGQSKDREGSYVQVSAGRRSACAIRAEDGGIECFGGTSPIPEEELVARQYTHVTLGKAHACAVDIERRLHCWKSGADLGGHRHPPGFQVGDDL